MLDPSLLHDYVFPNVGDEQQRHDDVCVDNIMTVVWESQSIPDDRRHDAHKFHIYTTSTTSKNVTFSLSGTGGEPWCKEMPKQRLGTLVQKIPSKFMYCIQSYFSATDDFQNVSFLYLICNILISLMSVKPYNHLSIDEVSLMVSNTRKSSHSPFQ